jgi:4-amino-4-deoxy-L-arabinose transferase-like glycosyltransferase
MNPESETGPQTNSRPWFLRGYWIAVFFIALLGCLLRFHVWHDFEYVGFDEKIYCSYLESLDASGIAGFPEIFRNYSTEVQKAEYVYLPPTRIGYLLPAFAIHKTCRLSVLESLRMVSVLSGCLFMLAGFLFALRWLNHRLALAVLALLACSPLQIHMTQYAFIDGVAALAALLSVACFWESLQHRGKWPLGFWAAFLFLLLTKQETAVFTGLFFAAILVCSRPLGLGKIGRTQLAAFLLAPASAILILYLLAGGCSRLLEVFGIYTRLSMTLPYTLAMGNGPWYRYLVEHLFVNPVVFLLAAGFGVCMARQTALNKYLLLFLMLTYAVMCSIPHGMNIRHTVMWDFPAVIFAVQCLDLIAAPVRRKGVLFAVMVAAVCVIELRQFDTIFVTLYDTDPTFMFKKVELIR